jgi:hypothetical protein
MHARRALAWACWCARWGSGRGRAGVRQQVTLVLHRCPATPPSTA